MHQIQWIIQDRVLVITFLGNITPDALYTSGKDIADEIYRQQWTDPIYLIVDVSQRGTVAATLYHISQIQALTQHILTHGNLSIIAVVDPKPIPMFRFVGRIITDLAGVQLAVCLTMQDALCHLQGADSSLDFACD